MRGRGRSFCKDAHPTYLSPGNYLSEASDETGASEILSRAGRSRLRQVKAGKSFSRISRTPVQKTMKAAKSMAKFSRWLGGHCWGHLAAVFREPDGLQLKHVARELRLGACDVGLVGRRRSFSWVGSLIPLDFPDPRGSLSNIA